MTEQWLKDIRADPDDTDWWLPTSPGKCWVCGEQTVWAYLDFGWQHRDCNAYPGEDGDVKIVRGFLVTSE